MGGSAGLPPAEWTGKTVTYQAAEAGRSYETRPTPTDQPASSLPARMREDRSALLTFCSMCYVTHVTVLCIHPCLYPSNQATPSLSLVLTD